MRFVNDLQSASSWYLGASNGSWGIGGDRFVVSTSASSTDAMFVLDDTNNQVDVRSNRVVNVANPVANGDAVNKGHLESHVESKSFVAPKDLSSAVINVTFAQCATHCRDLIVAGQSDWTVPSLEQLSHYVGFPGITAEYWTSEVDIWSDGLGTTLVRLRMLMDFGRTFITETSNTTATSNCRCVR